MEASGERREALSSWQSKGNVQLRMGVTRWQFQSRSQRLLTSYGACSTKTKARERTGSKSLQIVDLLYCITFQITNQDSLRTGPFQSPSFSSSVRRKKLEGPGYEIVTIRKQDLVTPRVWYSGTSRFSFLENNSLPSLIRTYQTGKFAGKLPWISPDSKELHIENADIFPVKIPLRSETTDCSRCCRCF